MYTPFGTSLASFFFFRTGPGSDVAQNSGARQAVGDRWKQDGMRECMVSSNEVKGAGVTVSTLQEG